MRDDDAGRVIDAQQASQLLQLDVDDVRRLTDEGVLPAHRLPGGRVYRYFADDLLDWLGRGDGAAPAPD